MKIGIEVQRLFRKNKFGIETSSLELIRNLRELEPKHEFIVFVKDDEDRNCLSASGHLRIKTLGGKLFVDFEQFFLPLAARREHVDVLHCTGNTRPFFSPVPVVQTLHDVIFMDAIPSGDSFYQRFGNHYRRKLVPMVTRKSQAVITVSQYEKERIMQRLSLDEDKLHVVYNGINHQRFNNHSSAARQEEVLKKYRLPKDFTLFLGNESSRKNPGRVIEAYVRYAAKSSHAMPLVTPGLSKTFVAQKLRQLNASYDSQQFFSPGYISDEDLPVLYSASKVFLFPSLSEGFGMPMIEAMACGTPVITSSTSCLPEIAGNAALLVNPLKADEIASAIGTLAASDEIRRTKIEAGLSNAKRFNWKRSAEAVLSLYESVYSEAQAMDKQPGLHKHLWAARD